MTFPTSIHNFPRPGLTDGSYSLVARTATGITQHELHIRDGYAWVVTGQVETTAGTQYIQEMVFGGHLQRTADGFLHTGFLDIPATSEEAFRRAYGDIQRMVSIRGDSVQAFAVGERIVVFESASGPWRYVNDFLRFFVQTVFGKQWWDMERSKPQTEQSMIVQWHDHLWARIESSKKNKSGVLEIHNTAAATSFMALAWDLFVAQDNKAFQESIIRRLKNTDQFQGARYELFVAATCVKAGYTIEFEDESDNTSKHGEFIATYRKTGERVLIEAKSKHRIGVLGYRPNEPKQPSPSAKFLSFINQALAKKKAGLPLVVFVDLNLPPSAEGEWSIEMIYNQLGKALFDEYGVACATKPEGFNGIVFTNHPVHWVTPDSKPVPHEEGLIMSQFPHDPLSSLEPITDLLHAAKLFGIYPQGFLK